MTYWKSQSFKALQITWYERLEEEGFQDAEKLVGQDLVLRQRASHPYRGKDAVARSLKESYFTLLAQQVEEAEFKCEIDRIVLTWHAAGAKIKAICEELERQGHTRCRTSIRFMIRRYEMAWGMREYSRRQLNRKE